MAKSSAAVNTSDPRRSFIRPSVKVKKYKKRLLNDGDFMNEFKLHLLVAILHLIIIQNRSDAKISNLKQ